MKVQEVMAKDVVTVPPTLSLKEVARILVDRRISGVPVVSEDGRLLGVVSESDILEKECDPARRPGALRALFSSKHRRAAAKREAQTAAEAMTSPAITVSQHASVAEAASIMSEHGVDRLVATDFAVRGDEPAVAGIVSRGDLVRAFARGDAEIEQEIRGLLERDFGLLPHEVRVRVERGRVTMEGQLDFKDTADAIEALVAIVPGVLVLDSRLTWRMATVPVERSSL